MFKLHVKELFEGRGIKFPFKTLLRLRIKRNTAAKMIKGEATYISFDHLYRLCVYLNCTPKELLKYHPDSQDETIKRTPLDEWIYKPDLNLMNELRNLTPEQFEQVKDFFKEIKKK